MIRVHDLGGDGPPLLVSHATGFTGLMYAPLAEELRAGFRVWSVDHRGHGGSEVPAGGDLRYAALAEDLLEVVSALHLERPFLFGHSMGGAVGLLAECRQPGTFSAAYVYEPAIVAEGFSLQGRERWTDAISGRRDAFASPEEAFAFFASREPYRRFRADALKAYADNGITLAPDGVFRLACRPEDEAKLYALNITTAGAFADLDLPVILACGAGDVFGAGLAPPAVAAVLPGAGLMVYDSLGHFGPLEAPALVGRDVLAALRGAAGLSLAEPPAA